MHLGPRWRLPLPPSSLTPSLGLPGLIVAVWRGVEVLVGAVVGGGRGALLLGVGVLGVGGG